MESSVARRNQILLVGAITGIYFLSMFQRAAVPGPIFSLLQQHYALTAAEVTLLGSVYLLVYGAMQPVAGIWADRWGGGFLVVLGGAALVLGELIFTFAANMEMLYFGRLLTAFGDGVVYLSVLKEVDRTFTGKSFAPVFSIACLIGAAGGIVATLPFRSLVAGVGMRWGFALITLISLVLYAFFLLQARRCGCLRPQAAAVKHDAPLRAVFRVLGNRKNYPVIFAVSLAFSICFALQVVIGVKFLQDRMGMSAVDGSGFIFMMLLVYLAWMLVAAPISTRFGSRRKTFLIGGTTCALIGSAILLCGASGALPGWLILLAFCLAGLQAGNGAVSASQLRELNAPELVATAVGILNAAAYLLIALWAWIIGLILDAFADQVVLVDGDQRYPAGAYVAIFLLFVVIAAASLFCALMSKETNGVRQVQ